MIPTANTPQNAPQGSTFARNGATDSQILYARVFVRHGEIRVTQYDDLSYGLHVRIHQPDKLIFTRLIFAEHEEQRDELLSFVRGMAELIE